MPGWVLFFFIRLYSGALLNSNDQLTTNPLQIEIKQLAHDGYESKNPVMVNATNEPRMLGTV